MKFRKSVIISGVILSTLFTSITNASNSSDNFKVDDYLLNPASAYVSEEQWNEIVNDSIEQREKKLAQERLFSTAKVINIDTRQKQTCLEIQKRLESSTTMSRDEIDSLCIVDEQNPYSSIIISQNSYETQGIKFSDLSTEQQNIVGQTRNFALLGAGVVGVLWMLPESVTKWDKEEIGGLGSKYKSNIKAGPVWDEDDWAVNYIGHPYSGAAYHVIARNAGLTPWQSFGYGVFMSTIIWEYGLEAAAEVPSIQDLVLTPVLGSLLGEAFVRMTAQIKKNKGELWGSKNLGAIAMAIMDPAGATLNGINNLLDNDFIKESRIYIFQRPMYEVIDPFSQTMESDTVFGVGIEFKF